MSFSERDQQFIIGLIGLSMIAFSLTMLFILPIPPGNRDTLNLVIGSVLGFGTAVSAFFLPGSVGSRAKDQSINKLIDQQHGGLKPKED